MVLHENERRRRRRRRRLDVGEYGEVLAGKLLGAVLDGLDHARAAHAIRNEGRSTLEGETAIVGVRVQSLALPRKEFKAGVAAHGADAIGLAADLGLALVVEAPKPYN